MEVSSELRGFGIHRISLWTPEMFWRVAENETSISQPFGLAFHHGKIYWNFQIIFVKSLREFYVWQFIGKLFIHFIKERRKY